MWQRTRRWQKALYVTVLLCGTHLSNCEAKWCPVQNGITTSFRGLGKGGFGILEVYDIVLEKRLIRPEVSLRQATRRWVGSGIVWKRVYLVVPHFVSRYCIIRRIHTQQNPI